MEELWKNKIKEIEGVNRSIEKKPEEVAEKKAEGNKVKAIEEVEEIDSSVISESEGEGEEKIYQSSLIEEGKSENNKELKRSRVGSRVSMSDLRTNKSEDDLRKSGMKPRKSCRSESVNNFSFDLSDDENKEYKSKTQTKLHIKAYDSMKPTVKHLTPNYKPRMDIRPRRKKILEINTKPLIIRKEDDKFQKSTSANNKRARPFDFADLKGESKVKLKKSLKSGNQAKKEESTEQKAKVAYLKSKYGSKSPISRIKTSKSSNNMKMNYTGGGYNLQKIIKNKH